MSYLASTRLIAGLVAIIPLYLLSVLAAFAASFHHGVRHVRGLYDHYSTPSHPSDLLWSFMQAIAMSIAVMLVHTYYAAATPAAGRPVGRGSPQWTSLIVVVVITPNSSRSRRLRRVRQFQPSQKPSEMSRMSGGGSRRTSVRRSGAAGRADGGIRSWSRIRRLSRLRTPSRSSP